MNKPLFFKGDTLGLISCSDGIKQENKNIIEDLILSITDMGLKVKLASTIYRKENIFSGIAIERAKELMAFYKDPCIKGIFDISGGDSANQVLPYLDYKVIKENKKPFFGYSDLTVLLNGIFTFCTVPTYHYQIRNLVGKFKEEQRRIFVSSFLGKKQDIYKFQYEWIKGKEIKGVVVGGNIRCFLKLAATKYLPNPNEKVLLLESLSGNISRITSLFEQLCQMGYVENLSGIILGTFTELQKENSFGDLEKYILSKTKGFNFPIIKTKEIGHGQDHRCIIIGEEIHFM